MARTTTTAAVPVSAEQSGWLPCRGCGAHVRTGASGCPVCGAAEPHAVWLSALSKLGPWVDVGRVGGAVLGLGLGTLGALFVLALPGTGSLLPGVSPVTWLVFPVLGLVGWLRAGARGGLAGLGWGLLASLVVAAALAGLLFKGVGMIAVLIGLTTFGSWAGAQWFAPWAEARWDRGNAQALLPLARRYLSRIEVLQHDLRRSASVRAALSRGAEGPARSAAEGALDAAEVAIRRQLATYVTEIWRIELLQWQHAAHPVLQMVRPGPRQQVEATATALADACTDLRRKIDRWRLEDEAKTERGAAILAWAARMWQACEYVRERLLLELAAQLAAGAPGISEAMDATGHWHEVELGALPELQAPPLAALAGLDTSRAALDAAELDLRVQEAAIAEVEALVPSVALPPPAAAEPFARPMTVDEQLARPRKKPTEHRSELDEYDPLAPEVQAELDKADAAVLLDEVLDELGAKPGRQP